MGESVRTALGAIVAACPGLIPGSGRQTRFPPITTPWSPSSSCTATRASRPWRGLDAALAATRINPRVSRTGNLLFSLLLFQVYLNLLILGQNWIARGQVSFTVFNVLLHGGMLAAGLLWLAKRQYNWNWWPVRRRGAAAQQNSGGQPA